jgi:hypothetical protein
MLSAPAINPVVLAATWTAFPGNHLMMVARLAASVLVSVVVGWIWLRRGDDRALVTLPPGEPTSVPDADLPRWSRFVAEMRSDLVSSGGYLVLGAGLGAAVNVLIPRSQLGFVATTPVAAELFLGLLAMLVAVCSQADAFVAAGLTQFSMTARLVFMVVGPAIDLKLFAMQTGTFGGRFATRFGVLTFVVAVACACLVGRVLL